MRTKAAPRRARSANPTEPLDYAAGRLGIGRNQTYAAARRGEIPVIRIGKSYRVLVDPFERILDGAAPMAANVPTKPLERPRRRRTEPQVTA